MSPWPGKYVIGLTGNIATGKSVVRRMLEYLGAYGIDADALAHRAISGRAPGHQQVVDYFGRWVLAADGEIDRAKLGKLVFSDPAALAELEKIIHPLVGQAVKVLAGKAEQKIIVIEAIKLLEGSLKDQCDAIWVTDADPRIQLNRLMSRRGMSKEDALTRIQAQAPQALKVAAADVVLQNHESIDQTWRQLVQAWKETVPKSFKPVKGMAIKAGELAVVRGGPAEADQIAEFWNRFLKTHQKMSRTDVMEAFGEKAFMLLVDGGKVYGLVAWQVENLVARATDLYFDPHVDLAEAAESIMPAVDEAAMQLQSEASLLFLPPDLAKRAEIWSPLGYEPRELDSLGVRAWQEAARDSEVDGAQLFFKQLRVDRVLRPI
jgi:dephospho-CoA kinase